MEKEKEPKIIDRDEIGVVIPICCKEGWDNCPHIIKKPKKIKRNVGL